MSVGHDAPVSAGKRADLIACALNVARLEEAELGGGSDYREPMWLETIRLKCDALQGVTAA